MVYINKIADLDACSEAIEWLEGAKHPTPEAAWNACSRADWMLWLLGCGQIDPRALVLCACDIVETVFQYIPAGENRPRTLVETVRRWLAGEATIEEVNNALENAGAYAGDTRNDPTDSTAAAIWAARACVWVGHASAYTADWVARKTSHAALYASRVAYASEQSEWFGSNLRAASAAEFSVYAAMRVALNPEAADIVRRHFPNPPKF